MISVEEATARIVAAFAPTKAETVAIATRQDASLPKMRARA